MIGIINYINGIFLGKEELTRQQMFLNNNLISLIRTSGTKGLYPLKDKYTVTFDGNILTFSGGQEGILGIDGSQRVIYYDRPFEVSLSDYVGASVYVSVKSNPTNTEKGTVSLSSTGVLTGTNTRFLDVLRGSYTKKGVKIFFPSNSKTYLVESVTSNTVAKLIGPIEEELSNVNWSVIGTFSPFSNINIENTFPYLYHSYEVVVSLDLPDENNNFVIGKVNWNGSTPVFEFIQNKASLLGFDNNGSSFDYVVDSDDSLRLLRSNSQATNVLIKKGTYTYTSTDGRGIVLHPNTKLVWAEGGSLVKIFSTPPAAAGSFAIGFNNPQPHDIQFYNLNIENNSFSVGYKNMNNLINCRLRYTLASMGSGFDACNRLINCRAISVNAIGVGITNSNYLDSCYVEGFSTGYSLCRSVSRCHAECSAGYSNCFASRRDELENSCADTANGGFNSALGQIPAPPISNYNRIYFQVFTGPDQEPIVRVNSDFNVTSNISFNVLVVNGLGKEEETNIHLLIGENFKEKSIIGLVDPTQVYSITRVTSSVASDGTYTYEVNY